MLQSCFLKTAVLLMLAALGGTGQTPPQFKERNPRYQLGRGDVLDINFPRTPEFTQTVTVEPDGFVSLRGAGDLHVLGLTVPGALEAIRGLCDYSPRRRRNHRIEGFRETVFHIVW